MNPTSYRLGRLTLPTGRSGRLLALGLLAILLALIWVAIGAPLWDWYDSRETALAGREAMAARMEVLATRLPALRQQADATTVHVGPGALLEGSSDAVAGAALQEQVQQMASALGTTLSSSETLAGSQAGAYRRVGVRISISTSFAVMVQLIAAIEQARPAMLLDDVQMHGTRLQMLGTAPLEGALTIYAYRRGDAPGNAQADTSSAASGAGP